MTVVGTYKSCSLLRYTAVKSECEPTFGSNVSFPSSGWKISRTRNQRASRWLDRLILKCLFIYAQNCSIYIMEDGNVFINSISRRVKITKFISLPVYIFLVIEETFSFFSSFQISYSLELRFLYWYPHIGNEITDAVFLLVYSTDTGYATEGLLHVCFWAC
jgi:hypothetical protein